MKTKRLLIPALIAAVAVLAHLRALNYGFVSDEKLLITQNQTVRELQIGEMITGKFWPGKFRGVYYRPAVTLSYGLGFAVAGESPWLHHLWNFVSHAIAAAGIYFLLLRLFKKQAPALLASVIFAAHPVHSESVAWIPGRTDVMAAAFGIFAWLAVLRARDKDRAALRGAWYAASLLLFVFALGSKEVAVVFPALVLAGDYLLDGSAGHFGSNLKKRIPEYAAMAAVVIVYLVVRAHILSGEGHEPAADPLAALPAAPRVLSMITVFACSFLVMAWPHPWLPDFAYENAFSEMSPALMLVAAAFLIALSGIAWEQRHKRPAYSFCIAGVLISILPFSHLAPFPTLFAERFLYLPSVFFCAGLGLLLTDLLAASSLRKPALALITFFVLVLCAHSAARTHYFAGGIEFWKSVVRKAPDLHLAHQWLGSFYQEDKSYHQAQDHYEQAVKLEPEFTPARLNLVYTLIMTGKPEEAKERLDKLAAKKNLQEKTVESVAELYNELGLAYFRRYQWGPARRQWERALELCPDRPEAHILLARLYLTVLGKKDKGEAHLEKARNIAPDHPLLKRLEQRLKKF